MRNGFSLIELLVVIAILGIISAVGLTVYNDFLTEAKKETTFASDDRVNRSIEQDYISLSNDLSGTTDIVGETNIDSSSNCYDYLKASVTGIDASFENAYNDALPYAVNLHVSGTTTLMEGQLGLQCANVCSSFSDSSYFFMRCTCTDGDCDLDSFTFGDSDASDYTNLSSDPTNPTDLFHDSDDDGIIAAGDPILVGPDVPEGYCPVPQTTFSDATVSPIC
jgi:prepilin-type N-terminal cleavage/methylation domain-containing protein